MAEKIKSTSVLVFIINALLVVVGFLVIKNKDSDRLLAQKEALLDTSPINLKILETQSAISKDREIKLNSQNTSAKETKKMEEITAKTTKTILATPAPTKKATTKTKTS